MRKQYYCPGRAIVLLVIHEGRSNTYHTDVTGFDRCDIPVHTSIRVAGDNCRFVAGALVDARLLRWTPRWDIVRAVPVTPLRENRT